MISQLAAGRLGAFRDGMLNASHIILCAHAPMPGNGQDSHGTVLVSLPANATIQFAVRRTALVAWANLATYRRKQA